MGLHQNKGTVTPGLALSTRERSKRNTTVTVKYSVPLLFPFIVFSPLTVSNIYSLHPIHLVNSENNKGYIYITEIVENYSFWIFGDLLEKLRRKLSDFSGISHLRPFIA